MTAFFVDRVLTFASGLRYNFVIDPAKFLGVQQQKGPTKTLHVPKNRSRAGFDTPRR